MFVILVAEDTVLHIVQVAVCADRVFTALEGWCRHVLAVLVELLLSPVRE